MRVALLAIGFVVVGVMGCQNQPQALNQQPANTTDPNCPASSTINGATCSPDCNNQETCLSMNDFRPYCSSCDLIEPYVNCADGGTTYTWYSARICEECALYCPAATATSPGTDVGNFCTVAFGGPCYHRPPSLLTGSPGDGDGNYYCGTSTLTEHSYLQVASFPGENSFYASGSFVYSSTPIQSKILPVLPNPPILPANCPSRYNYWPTP